MSGFPNRCQHLKINGTQCGSPALRRNRLCFFHKRFQDERIKLSADRARRGVATFLLPVLEDADSIQIALMQIMRLLLSQQIDHKTASLLLYALQTASTNLRLTNFKPNRHDVVLDPRDAADTSLDEHIWQDDDFEEEQDEEETAADRAIAALETARKNKEEEDKWMRWADAQYRNPTPKPNPTAAVTASGSAQIKTEIPPTPEPEVKKKKVESNVKTESKKEVQPEAALANPPKKPASSLNPAKVRQEIRDLVRKEFFPNFPLPDDAESKG